MKIINRIVLIIVFLFNFTGCMDIGGFAYDKKITGKYYLEATDVREQMNLCFQQGDKKGFYGTIIGPTVFAVGYNDKYIIVKQHPSIGPDKPWISQNPNQPDKSLTNYYIVSIQKDDLYPKNESILGPLTLDEFINKRQELNISDSLSFSIVFDDLK